MVGFACTFFGVHLGWPSQRGTLFWVDQAKKTWCISRLDMRYFDVFSVDKGTLFALYVFVISFIHQTFVLGLVYLITSQYDAKVISCS